MIIYDKILGKVVCVWCSINHWIMQMCRWTDLEWYWTSMRETFTRKKNEEENEPRRILWIPWNSTLYSALFYFIIFIYIQLFYLLLNTFIYLSTWIIAEFQIFMIYNLYLEVIIFVLKNNYHVCDLKFCIKYNHIIREK